MVIHLMPSSAHAPAVSPLLAVVHELGDVGDDELFALLRTAFVDAGFTDPSLAATIFAPASVRARGTLITARDPASGRLLGVIVLVAPGAAVRQIAGDTEAEMHLLAVSPDARQQGVGQALVDTLVACAREKGWPRIVLSTQTGMHAAQRLYLRAGFSRAPERDWTRGTRGFLAFTRGA